MEKGLQKLRKHWGSWDRVAREIGISSRTMGRYVGKHQPIPKPIKKLIIRMVTEIK